SLVDIDTEVSRQIQADYTVQGNVKRAREEAAAKERIGDAKFTIGDYVFMYTERSIPGVTQKIQIPYRGPYRIHKLYGQTAELIDGEKEIKVNVTKLVKLRNFTVPQRDLKGKVDSSVPIEDNKDDALEPATEVTVCLLNTRKRQRSSEWQRERSRR